MSNFIRRVLATLTLVLALHNALVAGDYAAAKLLIEHGGDVNAEDKFGNTPLHVAAEVNNLPVIKLLVESGASIHATTKSLTPVMKCNRIIEGYQDCYNYLMQVQNNLGIINNGIVYALYDYKAQDVDELSFTTGDELQIIRRDDSQEQQRWWAQKRTQFNDTIAEKREGYIPRNLVGLYPRVKATRPEAKIPTKIGDTGPKDEL